MKKILYAVTRAITAGGVMSIVSKKINYLIEKGYNVTLLSMTKCEKTFYPIHRDVPIIQCSENDDFKVSIYDLLKAINIIKKGDFDIIISADAQYLTWIIPFITKSKTILELHQSYDGLIDFYSKGRFSKLNIFVHRLFQHFVFPRYNNVIVLTEEDKIKWNLSNISVIPNFHCLQQTTNLETREKTIVCVGRFHFQKGYDILIEIWKLISAKYPDWKLLYYGTELNAAIKMELEKHKAPNSFILMGFEKQLEKIYSQAYLNVVPSRSESFSLSIIEAMCFGTPSVSFDITGPKSIIEDGKDGYLIKCFNIQEAARRIELLIEDKTKRNLIANNCIKKSFHYRRESVMEHWLSIFS